MKFDIAFTNKEITPWGGMAFLSKFLNKIGFREQVDAWLKIDIGIEICEQEYTAPSWQKPRRMIIVRQKIKEHPQAA